MTYLELVNAVLRRLREDEVTTVAESDYSKLIGDFVNDAVKVVEHASNWAVLRTSQDVTTADGTSVYSLTGFGTTSQVDDVIDDTNNRVLTQTTYAWMRERALTVTVPTGQPQYWSIADADANGDIQLRFYPTPNGVFTITAYGTKRNVSLVEDTDTTLLPPQPIIQFAFAYALRERGETGGQSAAEQLIFAQEDLRNYVAVDASLRPDDLIWYS